MIVKVTVTWGKEVFKNVEVDTAQSPLTFKTQLFSLTGVPPDRQKIMGVKGGLLKDDADWTKLGLKTGQKLMLMGSAEQVPVAPTTAVTFVEDLPEDEQDVEGYSKYGAGIKNAGNTCYMNSSLQCLFRVPELRTALKQYTPGGQVPMMQDGSHKLTMAARDLFAELDRSAAPVLPLAFLTQLRLSFPQFAEMSNTGMYKQQDAEECWTQILYSLRERLQHGQADSPVQKLFGVGLHTRLVCGETGEEIVEDNTSYALKCNISIDINLLHQGIALALKDDREKTSAITNQLTRFEGTSAITHLPVYLTVQMMRFYYKVDVRQKAKILRKVAFPLLLDCYEFSSPELKKELDGPRDALLAIEERAATAKRAGGAAAADKAGADKAAGDKATTDQAPAAKSNGNSASHDTPMPDAEPAAAADAGPSVSYTGQATGRYDLVAVLTHKGRSADSGHYVAWVKEEDGQWINFDDENIIPVKEADVLALAGGGDWHMANLLLYRQQVVPAEEK